MTARREGGRECVCGGGVSNVVIKRHRDTGREMNGAESRKIGQEAGSE